MFAPFLFLVDLFSLWRRHANQLTADHSDGRHRHLRAAGELLPLETLAEFPVAVVVAPVGKVLAAVDALERALAGVDALVGLGNEKSMLKAG